MLERIQKANDIKKLAPEELPELAQEIRQFLIEKISRTGGHLASTVGTHFRIKAERPAFMLLAYPVVTMNKDLTHNGSRENLLGKNPSDELVKLYSNELQVNKQTPPTFIIHARDDGAVPIANSENLLKALQKNKVPAKLVTYDQGGHGFGMRKKGIPVENWPQEMKAWLTERKLIK